MSTLATRFRSAQNSYKPAPPKKLRRSKADDWREGQIRVFRYQLWDYSTDPTYSDQDVDFLARLEHDIRMLESELEDIRSGLFGEDENMQNSA